VCSTTQKSSPHKKILWGLDFTHQPSFISAADYFVFQGTVSGGDKMTKNAEQKMQVSGGEG